MNIGIPALRQRIGQLLAGLALATLLGCATTSSTRAESPVFLSISPTELTQLMREEGYSVEEDNGVDWKLDGVNTHLLFMDGTQSIQFYVAYQNSGNSTLESVNQWNKTHRYSRSYLDDDNDPVLELDLDLAGGVTRDRILDFLQTCRASTSAWIRDVL